MIEQEIIKEWLRFAITDYEMAVTLFKNMHPKPLEGVCYHCQQSAEKSLKAYLHAKDGDAPWIHDLEKLCRLCAKHDKNFLELLPQCENLTTYSSMSRYPNQLELVESHAVIAKKQAKEIYDFTVSKL